MDMPNLKNYAEYRRMLAEEAKAIEEKLAMVDKWFDANGVPRMYAELERLEARKAELTQEVEQLEARAAKAQRKLDAYRAFVDQAKRNLAE
jgi:chromosome segregation ATPase